MNLKNNNFEKYILNDIDENIFNIWKSLISLNSYNEIIEYKNKIFKDFGDISIYKESYYNFRNWYNKKYWKTDTIENGIYLYFLYNSCLNNLASFGPSGFNQSFGNRIILSSENKFNILQNKKENIILYNKSYKEIINDNENNILFLDPPYYEQSASYKNKFNLDNHIEFLEIIKNKNCNIIYTDILGKYNSEYLKDWNKIKIRNIRCVSAKSKHITNNEEYIFYNFENNNLFKILD